MTKSPTCGQQVAARPGLAGAEEYGGHHAACSLQQSVSANLAAISTASTRHYIVKSLIRCSYIGSKGCLLLSGNLDSSSTH